MSFIQIENVSFSYPGDEGEQQDQVIRNISLSIEKGSYVAILGHNGSGKSTLAKLLNLILSPDSGRILIDGTDITAPDLTEQQLLALRQKVGMVFQNPDNQLVATIVEEDVAFGPENMGIPSPEIRQRVDRALALVGMTEYARHSPHQLSGGQKQRVAIAGVIAMEPQCILFDESTAMLDPSGRREVLETMEMLNRERGVTILTITHNMEEAIRADRVIVINDGQLFLDGTPAQVFSHVQDLQAVGLDVPQVTELAELLRADGIPLPAGLLTEEQTADAILDILSHI